MQTQTWHPSTDGRIEQALSNWTPDLHGTLVFVTADDHVLLIRKKSGHGAGLLNGPGGKLEPGEPPLQCAHRELREELCVGVRTLEPVARLRFIDLDGPQWLGYVYLGSGLDAVPTETAEAQPIWYPCDRLPLDQMWPDDSVWLPLILQGGRLWGDFLLSGTRLLAHRWRHALADELEHP